MYSLKNENKKIQSKKEERAVRIQIKQMTEPDKKTLGISNATDLT